MTTITGKTVVEYELDRVDAEELLYNTLGWGERPAFEIEMVAQSDEWIVLMGDADEMRRWSDERWVGLARSKGWWARPLVLDGRVVDWNG